MRVHRMRAMQAFIALLALWTGVAGTFPAGALADPDPNASASPSPKPEATKASLPPLPFTGDVVFTLALGNDGPTNARLAVTLASRLQNAKKLSGFAVKRTWIVPEGGWGIPEYLQQCATDSHTRGAFIIMPPSSRSSSENYIALLRTSTSFEMTVMVAECRQDAHLPGDTAVVWVSDATSGDTGRTQVLLFPLAILTSVYLAFAPQRSYQTTTTVAYPTPNPLPPGGARTSVATQQTSVLNSSGTSSLQGNVVNAFSGGLGATIGAQRAPESQVLHAADDAIGHLLQSAKLNDYCHGHEQAPMATPTPTPTPTPAPTPTPTFTSVQSPSPSPTPTHAPYDPFAFCSW